MSFSSDVKKELIKLDVQKKENIFAELYGFFISNFSLNIIDGKQVIDLKVQSEFFANRIISMLKTIYKYIEWELREKKGNIYKNYSLSILNANNLIKDFKLLDNNFINFSSKYEKASFLRGLFIATGTINDPNKGYHFELWLETQNTANYTYKVLKSIGLEPKFIERKNFSCLYIKESQKISSFLTMVGSENCFIEFEELRIIKDMMNNENRLNNIEISNIGKTTVTALKQVDAIKKIKNNGGLRKYLTEKEVFIADSRLKYRFDSLSKMTENISKTMPISKSGVNHILNKIIKISEKI